MREDRPPAWVREELAEVNFSREAFHGDWNPTAISIC
jgi:hypothetical protein